MSQTVAEVLVNALERIGVRHIFGLIGDSLNPLADAVRRSEIEWIGVRHEEGGALAAAGQAKLTGQLGVCCGTTGPGSTHLVAGLYEAARDHAPVLAISGDMPRKVHGTDFIQTTEPDLLFRDVSLYTETISSPAQAPAVIHQAIAASYGGRGVAHLTIPQDVFESKADGGVSSIATLKPCPEIVPSENEIAELARQIDAARTVVIMCGGGCRGAADELRALSDRIKAPLIHSVKGQDILAYDDPRWIGGIGMIGTKASYNAAVRCDSYSEFLPHKGAVAQIDDRAEVLGRRTPTALGVFGSVRFTKIRLVADGRDLVVQPRNDRPRGARRSDKGKIDRREIWKSELAQGRHIGKQSRARLRIDGKRFHRAGADVGNEVRQPDDGDQRREQTVHHVAAAANRDIDEIGAGFLLPVLVAQSPWLCPRDLRELAERSDIERRTHHHDLGVDEGIGDRRKVLLRIVGNRLGELIERQGFIGQEANRIAVIGRIGTGAPGDDHGAAGPVLDDDRLPQPSLQLFRKRPHENIARAPRAIGGDDAERPRWVILRSRRRERVGGEDCKTGQKPNAETTARLSVEL